jgi:hypothetical protein
MLRLLSISAVVVLSLFLLGCGDGGTDVKAERSSPEYAATKFFLAIYEDKSMDEVVKYTTPKMTRVVKGYGSIQGITRNMLNMYFDKVSIEIDKGRNLRESYGDKATITLIFNGTYKGGKVSDMRTVKLVKRSGEWYVEKVNDDPFAR